MCANQLLKSLIDKDPDGVKEIYKIIFPKVRGFVLSNKGSVEDAKDVFQRALLQIIIRVKVDDIQIASFEAYLYTACKNLWRREINRNARVTNLSGEEYRNEMSTADIALETFEQERWELYQRCFQKLSDNCQKVLQMYFDKVSYAQIKDKLSYASETVVRQRVFKCKTKLSKLVREDSAYNCLKDL